MFLFISITPYVIETINKMSKGIKIIRKLIQREQFSKLKTRHIRSQQRKVSYKVFNKKT